jgi:GGDEF domain-containing protein/HPt (histidine-containing phosphotransfer) domain-containing protein
MADALDALWASAEPSFRERVDVIEDYVAALLTGSPGIDAPAAESAAHKLAGTLGMFGMSAGSALARELEEMIRPGTGAGSTPQLGELERMAEIVNGIRADLDSRSRASGAEEAAKVDRRSPARGLAAPPLVRIVGRDSSLLESLRWALRVRRARCEHVASLSEATSEPASVVLVDAASVTDPFRVVGRLADADTPVLVVADSCDIAVRARLVECGADAVIGAGAGPDRIADDVVALVDDTAVLLPVVVAGLPRESRVLLERALGEVGCIAHLVDDPGDLGAAIDDYGPAAVIIGADLGEIELERALTAIRSDSLWADRWVAAVVPAEGPVDRAARRAYEAGADAVHHTDEEPTAMAESLRSSALRRGRGNSGAVSTGPKARALLIARIEALHEQATLSGRPMSVLYFKLPGLAELNAAEGHSAGDALLDRTRRILFDRFRGGDLQGPWVGSGFVVAMSGDRRTAEKRLAGALADLDDAGIECRGGVATSPGDGADVDALMGAAAARAEGLA